ncbi:MAG TPA: ATP-binding protein [Cellvibrionaceae bacterium]
MGRVFFSLYGLILATLVGAGFILDQLVGSADDDALSPAELILADFAATHTEQLPYITPDGTSVEILSDADLTNNQTLSELKQKKSLIISSLDPASGIHYRDVFHYRSEPAIIHIRYPVPHPQEPWQYRAILLVVYLFIGLAVFSWLWPLMRDLRRLALQTQQLDFAEVFCGLTLKKNSPLFGLSEAFCCMSQRLHSVLTSYKEMTYAVSHELRTPLARMKFALAMAQDQMAGYSVPQNVQEQWQSLWLDVNEMDALVNQLLNYASFEQENRQLYMQTENIKDFLSDLVQRARKANPDLIVTLECTQCATQVAADWQLMERVMVNLLENAARFAESTIQVRASTPGEQVVITVCDDGPGVPRAEHSRVFESFVRLNNTQNSSKRGFGLGLAIVKRLMRWHSGDIHLSDSPLGGACFTLHWPRDNTNADKNTFKIG